MRWPSKRAVAVAVCGGCVGGAVLLYTTRQRTTESQAPKTLSAEAFNALQDPALLSEALGAAHLPWRDCSRRGKGGSPSGRNFDLTLYRLMGCPYCAKVEWLLRFSGVPFETVTVDTLSGNGIPDPRYQLVPQIRLKATAAPGDPRTKEGEVYVVDSQHIITAVSVPLGFADQLGDPRIAETRKWISERFQTASFVAANSTWGDAYITYPHVTPPRYHNMFCRLLGASVLYALARHKIAPTFVSSGAAEGNGNGAAMELLREEPAAWLGAQLEVFATQLSGGGGRLHGGKEPDIADVEMYAVTRIINGHPNLRRRSTRTAEGVERHHGV